MKTKLQTLIIRFADSDHKTCGINSLYVMVSTRPRSWCQHAPMASTSRNACINSPHVMVSTHLESWYQLAPGHGINLPQVKLTRWMEVIQWIFTHEILQNVADNGKLCKNVRWTMDCAKMCGEQKIVWRTGICAISHWPHLNIACVIDTVAYGQSPQHRTIALHNALVDIFQWSGVCHGRERD